MTRCNSDGYLAQMEKVNKLKENKDFKVKIEMNTFFGILHNNLETSWEFLLNMEKK